MYKLLLCSRYLMTRYLALVCIVSVMLGVATLIVVNSVMSGFSTKLKDRLHGLLSDVIVESRDFKGFSDPYGKMQQIAQDPYLRDKIEAMTPTMEVFAMLQFRVNRGDPKTDPVITKPVRLIGIDPKGRASIGGFSEFLVNEENRRDPSFKLREKARQIFDSHERQALAMTTPPPATVPPGDKPPPDPPPADPVVRHGIIIGNAVASFRGPDPNHPGKTTELWMLNRDGGDEVVLYTIGGERLDPVYDRFAVCDYFKSEMSEYDATYVFVELEHLQKLRTMQNRATSIEIKLKPGCSAADVKEIKEHLWAVSAGWFVRDPLTGQPLRNERTMEVVTEPVMVSTWEEKQGPLLSAIAIEKGLLNVLLFMIIAVAGFGILAIFSMIVTEKTRDIGILKSLGASNFGVLSIFLGYGLLLGMVGAVLGTGLGLTFTVYINEIQNFLTAVTGQEVFNKDVYYFKQIPTDIQPLAVVLVNAGSVIIAVLFSILPALRAALIQPVRALRYE